MMSNMGTGEGIEAATSPSPGVVLLGDAISVLRSEWASTFSDVSRLTSLRELWPQVCALSAHVTERIGDIHVAGAATADAFASTTALLRTRLRMSGGEAGKFIRVAVGLRKLRAVTAAFAEGRISLEHADAICHVAADLGDAAMADGQLEQVLLEYALVKNSTDVRQLGRMIKSHIISKESAEERQVRMYEGRWLQSATTFDGMVHLEAMLDPITGAAVQAALAAYMPGPDKDRSRTPRQRRADALADIVTVALANKDRSLTGDEKPHVTVTIPLDTLLHGHPTARNTNADNGDTGDSGAGMGDGESDGDGDGRPSGADADRGQGHAGATTCGPPARPSNTRPSNDGNPPSPVPEPFGDILLRVSRGAGWSATARSGRTCPRRTVVGRRCRRRRSAACPRPWLSSAAVGAIVRIANFDPLRLRIIHR